MFALADVNSFYTSCEKLFRPDLRHRPVVVLSNNDGCVIARSVEAKALGIKMAEPWFKVQQRHLADKVVAFSSNYALYHSLSQRVMRSLEQMAPRCEQYSIDEMFLDLQGVATSTDLLTFGRAVRSNILRWTGLTLGVGMGPTKTLAKSAQWASKEWPQFNGVLLLSAENRTRTEKLLARQPVDEVWGVGRRLAKRLQTSGIHSALDLAKANPATLRRQFSVVLERTIRELNWESCLLLEEIPAQKQQIMVSRSFGQVITDYASMREAIVLYAQRAAEKLREDNQYCQQICTFIRTSPFTHAQNVYSNQATERRGIATDDTRDIIASAVKALDKIWRNGPRYIKAGIMLTELSSSHIAQLSLFDEASPRANSEALMSVLDKLNGQGDHLWFAGQGINQQWKMKRTLLSPAYTTQWLALPEARIG
ncbi:MAG: Protein UmuC [Candidatus Erwinia impunctatus]|nr:Protein UmuC [Culicoides impunctatus]